MVRTQLKLAIFYESFTLVTVERLVTVTYAALWQFH